MMLISWGGSRPWWVSNYHQRTMTFIGITLTIETMLSNPTFKYFHSLLHTVLISVTALLECLDLGMLKFLIKSPPWLPSPTLPLYLPLILNNWLNCKDNLQGSVHLCVKVNFSNLQYSTICYCYHVTCTACVIG